MFKRLNDAIEYARFALVHRRSPRAIRRWQEKYLRTLVAHAATNVPAYHTLLKDAGIDAARICRVEDIARLPIIEKSFFLKRPTEEYVDASKLTHAVWRTTSGVSGKPMSFLSSSLMLNRLYVNLACLRFVLWNGEDHRYLQTMRVAQLKIRSGWNENWLLLTVADLHKNPGSVFRALNSFRPAVITSTPTVLTELARHVERDPMLLTFTPRYAVSYGEVLRPDARAYIDRVLSTETYDRYGLGEIGAIGTECRVHDGFHVHSESVLLEIVDERGAVLPAGAPGRVIATDLFNYDMPFIRYDTGDRGYIMPSPCACGLDIPRIKIEGRQSASLVFGGLRVDHLAFNMAIDGYMHEIYQYQVVKRSDTHATVRIIPGPAFSEMTNGRVRDAIKSLTGSNVEVTTEIVSSIPLTPNGKRHILADESGIAAPTDRVA